MSEQGPTKHFDRREFISLAFGIIGSEKKLLAEIKSNTSWSEGLREMKKLAQTEKREYGQIYLIAGNKGYWQSGLQEGTSNEILLDDTESIIKFIGPNLPQGATQDSKIQLFRMHTHPGNKHSPPSCFLSGNPPKILSDFLPILYTIDAIEELNTPRNLRLSGRDKKINIDLNEGYTGMAYDGFGIWVFKLDLSHPVIQKLRNTYGSNPGDHLSRAVKGISQEVNTYMQKSTPNKEDLQKLIQAYLNIGVRVQFHEYNSLNTNLPPGQLGSTTVK